MFKIFIAALLSTTGLWGLTLDEAMQRALKHSHSLKIASKEIGEKRGQRLQSSLYPNPVFGYEVENILGNHNWEGWGSAESAYVLEQEILLGGKREHGMKAASFQVSASIAAYEVERVALINQLIKQFVLVASLQEQESLTKDLLELEQENLKATEEELEAGKITTLEKNTAEISRGNAALNLIRIKSELKKAKGELALLWGAESFCPEEIEFPLFELVEPKSLYDYQCALERHPHLRQDYFNYKAARQELALEKAEAIPNLSVLVGIKTNREEQNKGMILGAAIPIPLFDRNQGNIRSARSEAAIALEHYQETQAALRNRLLILHHEAETSFEEVKLIQSSYLSPAENAFNLTKEGYDEGKFEFSDFLESKKVYYEAKKSYIESILLYHERMADLTYLNIEES